jgi:hypothetical protein
MHQAKVRISDNLSKEDRVDSPDLEVAGDLMNVTGFAGTIQMNASDGVMKIQICARSNVLRNSSADSPKNLLEVEELVSLQRQDPYHNRRVKCRHV